MTSNLRWVAAGLLALGTVVLVLTGAYRPVEAPAAFGIAAAIVAAALAAAMVVLAVTRPWDGMLLFVAAMPIVNVARAQANIGPIQLLPVTLVILALALGVALRRRQPRESREGGWTWLALGLAAALAVASTVATPLRGAAANVTLHGVLEPMAIFAIVVALRPSLRQLTLGLLAFGTGVVVATLVNFAWLLLVVGPRDLYEQRMLFARLTYFNVGIFATSLVMAIPAVASVLFGARPMAARRASSVAAWLAIGLIVVALFFTYTKSAWLSAALVAALMVVLLVQRWRRRAGLLLAIAVLLAVVVPYPLAALRVVAPGLAAAYESLLVDMQGSGRVESWDPDTYNGSGSIGIRLEAIGAAAQITASAPLLGVGPGGFQQEFERIRPDASVPELQSAHNLLPNLAAEYGLPFALLVAIGLVLVIWRAMRSGWWPDPLARVTAIAIGLSLVGFLAMATLFGADLYRAYRTMNGDVVAAALLAGLAWMLPAAVSGRAGPQAGQAIEQDAQLLAAGSDEGQGSRA